MTVLPNRKPSAFLPLVLYYGVGRLTGGGGTSLEGPRFQGSSNSGCGRRGTLRCCLAPPVRASKLLRALSAAAADANAGAKGIAVKAFGGADCAQESAFLWRPFSGLVNFYSKLK